MTKEIKVELDHINTCAEGHPCITYRGDSCPLCKVHKQLEMLLKKNEELKGVILRQNIKLKKVGVIKNDVK